jgi:saccharopine dehydrogenase (NAD+, L-lysine forming)
VIAQHLTAAPTIRSLVLTDLDGDLARRTADDLRSDKVRSMRLDASDVDAVRTMLRGIDLVVNATLPRFNPAIQEAALDDGVDYLDLSNDIRDPFHDSPRWKDAGLTSLHGMGEDPGLSNVFARHAADGLDRVDTIKIRDGDTASSPDYPFVSLFSPETFLEETLAPSRIWKGDAYVDVPPLGEREVYEFPPPVGSLVVYSVDHEETDTLPHFIGKGVRYVDFKLALDDATVRSLTTFRNLGFAGAPGGMYSATRRAILNSIPKPADLRGRVEGHAALVVEVDGWRGGERQHITLSTSLGHAEAFRRFGTTATSYLTGTGAAVGALLLAAGQVPGPGKLSPEQLDPRLVFPLLRERGIDVQLRRQVERRLN